MADVDPAQAPDDPPPPDPEAPEAVAEPAADAPPAVEPPAAEPAADPAPAFVGQPAPGYPIHCSCGRGFWSAATRDRHRAITKHAPISEESA